MIKLSNYLMNLNLQELLETLEKDILKCAGSDEVEQKKKSLIKIIEDRRLAAGDPLTLLKTIQARRGEDISRQDDSQDMIEIQDS
jgi:hypothetical protein